MKLCNVCNERPKAPGRGRRTCSDCQGKCKRCKKPLSEKLRCDDCSRTANREKYRNDPAYAERKRIGNKLSLYGITREEYDALVWSCRICDRTDGKLVIDHHHQSGKVRAVLCSNCNTALGLLREDPAIMASMIRYIEETK